MKSEDEAASCSASCLQGSVGAVRKSFFLYQQLSGSRNKTLLQGCSFRQFDRDGLATAMWRKLNGKVHDGTDWLFSRHVDRSTAPSSRGPACQTLYLEKVNNRTGIAFRVMSDEHLLLAVSSANKADEDPQISGCCRLPQDAGMLDLVASSSHQLPGLQFQIPQLATSPFCITVVWRLVFTMCQHRCRCIRIPIIASCGRLSPHTEGVSS